jgi:hypothetical protein
MKFPRTILASGIALAAVAALSACGSGTTTTTTTATTAPAAGGEYGKSGKGGAIMKTAVGRTIKMGAMNGSGQNGTATIVTKGTGIMVTVTVSNEPKGASEPAHIHAGTCAKLNPAPWKPLSNVVNGVSTTTVPGVTTAQLTGKTKYAINVHKSAAQITVYVSCGGI